MVALNIVLALGDTLSWPVADAPHFRRRLALTTTWQKVFAAAIFTINVYVLVRILWRHWGMGAILPSLVVAALMTALIVLAQFRLLPAMRRRLTPLPVSRLLGQGTAAATGPPARGGHPMEALRHHLAPAPALPRGDEDRRRTLLVDLQARLRRSAGAPETVSGLEAVLEQEPLAVLEALTANLRPKDDLAFFLYSWAAVPSNIKLDFLAFRNIFDAERLDATSGSTAGAAAQVVQSVHAALGVVPGSSLAIEGVRHHSKEGITELLKVAYESYLRLARTVWDMMSNAQRRDGASRAVFSQAAAQSMTAPLALVVLSHRGKSAAILRYMERRDIHPYKINAASLGSHLSRRAA